MFDEKDDRAKYKPVFVDEDRDQKAKAYRDYLIKESDEDRAKYKPVFVDNDKELAKACRDYLIKEGRENL